MKSARAAVLLVTAVATGFSASGAWADRDGHGEHRGGFGHEHHEHHERHEWHGHGGIYLGPTFFWPGYGLPFGDPMYPYPPAPVVVQPPPVYIERADGNPPDAAAQLWYYCEAAGAYYPYVRQCPTGWKAVVPQQR